jgi:hypothetical protein
MPTQFFCTDIGLLSYLSLLNTANFAIEDMVVFKDSLDRALHYGAWAG